MRPRDLAVLFFLAGLWGGTASLTRVAAPEFGIPAMIGARLVVATAILAAYAGARRALPEPAMWRGYVVLGVVNAALPLALQAFAATHLPTSLSSILTAPTPLFAALVARVWLGDPLTVQKLAGMVLGIFGVALLVGLAPITPDAFTAPAVVAALGSAFSYAVGTAFTKARFAGVRAVPITTGQIAVGALLWLPLAVVNPPAAPPSLAAIAAVAVFGVLSTALGYLMFFGLVDRIGPARTLSVTLLIPCFGVLWGWLFLNEPVAWSTVAGLLIVLGSVLLVAGVRLRP